MSTTGQRDSTPRARRRGLLVVAVLVVAAGLITHVAGSGATADFVGDALYAVMIYLVVPIAFPRAALWIVGCDVRDFAAYAVGVGAAILCDVAISRRRRARR